MAFAISTPTSSLWRSSSSYSGGKPPLFVLSNSAVSFRKHAIYRRVIGIPQLGSGPFAEWNGLKQLGISISQYSVKMGKKKKGKGKEGVYASLFGVGAPEALVIGVVALLVFGPKGLAEVARNLGKTLRAFQPTIRELQDVSREFKSTLEREIGLDEIDRPVPRYTPKPTPQDIPQELKSNVEPSESPLDNETPSESGAYTTDEYLKVTEAQLKGTLAQLQKEQQENSDKPENQSQTQTSSQDASPSEKQESNALQEDVPKSKPET